MRLPSVSCLLSSLHPKPPGRGASPAMTPQHRDPQATLLRTGRHLVAGQQAGQPEASVSASHGDTCAV